MACPAKDDKKSIQILTKDLPTLPIHQQRLAVCNLCDRNINGICRTVAAQHGKQNAIIEAGIRRFSLKCPKNKWLAVKVICPSCDRYIIVDERVGLCSWCTTKKNMGRHNRHYSNMDNRDHSIVPSPFESEPIKHLHYFLYPRYEESVDYHISQLKKSMHIFNGKKICCVAIDGHTNQEKYESELNSLFSEVYYVQNNPQLREAAGFISTLEKLRSKDSNHVICFAHGKGQQHHTKSAPLIRNWSDAMYETCVRNWDEVKNAMEQGYPIAGSFKSIGAFRTTAYRWHYSGSFWWARSNKFFYKNWKQMCDQWWSAESYVGRHYTREEGYCLFGQSSGSLYEHSTWNVLSPILETWRDQHNVLS